MQCTTKKLSDEFLTYWRLKYKTHQHNNIFQSNSINIGNDLVVKVNAFSTKQTNSHTDDERRNGILLIVTTVADNYLKNKTSFFDLYFNNDCSDVKYATYSGHGPNVEKIGGKEMLKIMKVIHGFKASNINELYRKMKILNVSIV